MALVKSLDFGSVIFSFGKQLKTDEHGKTNFLLAGIGGGEHDGANLTDTLIIASLDQQTKQVKMLSIPRDLYIEDKVNGGERINKIYDSYYHKNKDQAYGMEKLSETVTKLTGIPIQYSARIDFNGFVKIVDALGGITVNVEHDIHDPFYPKGETIKYETFDIKAGIQELDGETALKYARSRKTTSDFDRAKRQQQTIAAIKEKALSSNVLTDPAKIQNIYNSVADSIETNLSVSEILELAKIAKDINKDKMESRVLTDDFTSCGGFLYTPNRDNFGGAAVLLPAGNEFDEINRFSKEYFYSPSIGPSAIQVLNATKTPGLAQTYLNRISRDCLDVTYFGNATNREQAKSVIYYNKDQNGQIPAALNAIKEIINAPVLEGIPAEYLQTAKRASSQIVIEIGADYKSITSADPFSKLLYTAPTIPKTTTETTAQPEAINIRKTSSETDSNNSTPDQTGKNNTNGTKKTTTTTTNTDKPTTPSTTKTTP